MLVFGWGIDPPKGRSFCIKIPPPFPRLRWWIEPKDLQTTCGKHFKNQKKPGKPTSASLKKSRQKKRWRCFLECFFASQTFYLLSLLLKQHATSCFPSASCFPCPPAINVWDPRSNRMLALVAIGSESLGPVSPVSIYLDGGCLMVLMGCLIGFW